MRSIVTPEETSVSSIDNTGVTPGAPEAAYEPDESWEDCSLCEAGDSFFDEDRVLLPGREGFTSDIGIFLRYVERLRKKPRANGEPLFREDFWVFVKGILERAAPLGYTDMPNRNEAMHKGPKDNNAFIEKYIGISPVNPIYPNFLAGLCGIPLEDVLTELLYSAMVGMTTMRFSPICERCGSPTCAQSLPFDGSKLPVRAFCRACRFTSAIDCLEKIKVVFVFSSDILYTLAENLPCKPSNLSLSLSEIFAMVPATFSGSGFKFSFGCDGGMMLRPAFSAGKYRMHCAISLSDCFFVVERNATEDDEPCTLKIHVSDLDKRKGPRKTLSVPHGKVRIEVFCDTKCFFILFIQQNVGDDQLLFVPQGERCASTSALTVMSTLAYKTLYEGTQQEASHVAVAMAQMTLDADDTAPIV